MSGTGGGTIRVVDSHTEGEPTRVVVSGFPELDGDTMAERRDFFRAHWDHFRSGLVREPRGHDAVVGAVITDPVEPDSACGVVFFNDVGYLGMCGHGLIGLAHTLRFLDRVNAGEIRVDTPVGTVTARYESDGSVTIRNVESWCETRDLTVQVPGIGPVTGDVAWGGNWFFITPWDLSASTRALTEITLRIRDAVWEVDPRVDHVELFAAPTRTDADARNFVLCPGVAYDRSPCGTGTSAKMAVLHARGDLSIGELWRQESITGSLFTGWLEQVNGKVLPHIRGRAYITGETTLHFHQDDPFRWGISG